jgi:hypothetical protein
MARRWWKSGHLKPGETLVEPGSTIVPDKHWQFKMGINGFGALCTLVVMVMFAITKFKDGAWIIILLVPALVTGFFTIHHHYKALAKKLSLQNFASAPRVKRHRVLVLIAGVHRGSLYAMNYARSLAPDVTAVHISVDAAETEKVREKWSQYGEGVRMVVIESPYRMLLEPLMEYIENILKIRQTNELLTIVVPQFVPSHWWENLLHNQTALMLRFALLFKPGVVIVEVPYQV